MDDATKQKVETFTLLLDEYSKPGDKVFLNYYAPMVYFISNRRNPTRYDYTGLPEEYQREIIQTLERKNIQTILTFTLNKNDNSVVGEYIQQNYQKQKTLDEYDVWLRK